MTDAPSITTDEADELRRLLKNPGTARQSPERCRISDWVVLHGAALLAAVAKRDELHKQVQAMAGQDLASEDDGPFIGYAELAVKCGEATSQRDDLKSELAAATLERDRLRAALEKIVEMCDNSPRLETARMMHISRHARTALETRP